MRLPHTHKVVQPSLLDTVGLRGRFITVFTDTTITGAAKKTITITKVGRSTALSKLVPNNHDRLKYVTDQSCSIPQTICQCLTDPVTIVSYNNIMLLAISLFL